MARYKVMAEELGVRGGDNPAVRFSAHEGDVIDGGTVTAAGLDLDRLLRIGALESAAAGAAVTCYPDMHRATATVSGSSVIADPSKPAAA